MIIIHNSALAIDRFIANSENEQTSNELADVVHGVVAGTESADILMTILMVFLIKPLPPFGMARSWGWKCHRIQAGSAYPLHRHASIAGCLRHIG